MPSRARSRPAPLDSRRVGSNARLALILVDLQRSDEPLTEGRSLPAVMPPLLQHEHLEEHGLGRERFLLDRSGEAIPPRLLLLAVAGLDLVLALAAAGVPFAWAAYGYGAELPGAAPDVLERFNDVLRL